MASSTVPGISQVEPLKGALRRYFVQLQEVYRTWQEMSTQQEQPLRVMQTRLEELRLVESVQDSRIPAEEKNKVVRKLKACIDEELRMLQSSVSQQERKVALLRELRVKVDECMQQLGWDVLVAAGHHLSRGEGRLPSVLSMVEWAHDSCFYYQHLLVGMNNILALLVEDGGVSSNFKSCFLEEPRAKEQLQGILARTFFFVQDT